MKRKVICYQLELKNSLHADCSVLILYFGACYVRVVYGFLECILLLVCSHAVHVFPWYVSVVHCVYNQTLTLTVVYGYSFCAQTQQLATSYGIMATVTLGQVELFELEGGDWNVYTKQLDQFLVANGVADGTKKVAVFLTIIGGRAYAMLRNLLAPTKPSDKSYSELVKVMKDHLKPKPLVIAERFKFYQRDQRDSETVAQHLAELHKLTEKCGVP